MKPKIRNYGRLKTGIFYPYKPQLFEQVKKDLEGKEVEVVIQERVYDTTMDQHGYWRAGIIRTCMQTEIFGGWSEDDIHDFLMDENAGYDKMFIIKGVNKIKRMVPSMASLSKKETAILITKTLAYLSTLGIFPEEPQNYIIGKYKTQIIST